MRAVALASRGTAARERYSRYIRSLAPLSYWRLNEPAGATNANNETSTSGMDLTQVGGVTFGVTGRIPGNTAAAFDGVNDYLTNGVINPWAGDFTILLWVKPDVISFDVYAMRETYQTNGFRFGTISTGSTGKVTFWTTESGGGVDVQSSQNLLSVGQWSLVAVTRGGTTFRVYHNGANVGSGTGTYIAPSAGIQIGGNTQLADVTIDEPTVWDRALSADEVATAFALAAVY